MEEDKLSVVIITYNEEKNIRGCLENISWADEIVVVDTFSKDKTVEIVQEYTDKIYKRKFDSFEKLKNYALTLAQGDWLLSLDADERITPQGRKEIESAIKKKEFDGFYLFRKNYLVGHPINYVWGPDMHLRLFRKDKVKFEGLVHEKAKVKGKVDKLKNPFLHFNASTWKEYILKNELYASLEAKKKLLRGERFNILKLFLSPIHVFFFRYFQNKGYKDKIIGLILSILLSYFTFRIHYKLWLETRG